ncbi:hypothetical protein F4781DRAFT_189096 [Annulohypoxylon bovei var. microspora]|nr:hypothetical protein F4781DRAFT_189096 [Annulohypoxylon bovei var. microspora]
MGDACPSFDSYGASHARMANNNMKFCQFCGTSLLARTNRSYTGEDDSVLITDASSWKPNERSKRLASDEHLSPADRLALIPRRPAPPALIKREYPAAMSIPASSDPKNGSTKKNPPHHSAANWFHFNITISITKWTIDHNDPIPIPRFHFGSFQIVHNFDTSIRGTRITGINDWWDRLASASFVRKDNFASVYPVAFYKNLTKTSFTDLNVEAQDASDVRTVWDSLPPTKSPSGKQYRKIHVTFQNITHIPKDEDSEAESRTKAESDDDVDEPRVKIKEEPGVKIKEEPVSKKRKASASMSAGSPFPPHRPSPPKPQFMRYESVSSLESLTDFFGLREKAEDDSRTKEPSASPTQTATTPSQGRIALTPPMHLPFRPSPANSPVAVKTVDPKEIENRGKQGKGEKQGKAPVRVSSRSTKAIPASRLGEE